MLSTQATRTLYSLLFDLILFICISRTMKNYWWFNFETVSQATFCSNEALSFSEIRRNLTFIIKPSGEPLGTRFEHHGIKHTCRQIRSNGIGMTTILVIQVNPGVQLLDCLPCHTNRRQVGLKFLGRRFIDMCQDSLGIGSRPVGPGQKQ